MTNEGCTLEPDEGKEKQIKSEINLLAYAKEILSSKLTILLSRLSGAALREDSPCDPNAKAQPAKPLVDIATDIRSIRWSIENDTKTVMDILDRLEI